MVSKDMKATQPSRQIENNSSDRLLRILLGILIGLTIAAFAVSVAGGYGWLYIVPTGVLFAISIVGYFFLTRGISTPAQILLPTSLFIVVTYIIAFPPGYGLHDINLLAYAIVISLAGLTLGNRGAYLFTFLIILAVSVIGIAEMRGIINSPTSSLTLPISPIAISIVVLAITLIQRSLINLLSESAQRAHVSEKAVMERNEELEAFSARLEDLVQTRTSELNLANFANERRAHMFQAIAQVTRVIISTQNLQDLLPQITQMISQQFGFYHIGVFLVDQNGEYAVLSAANSEGGERMLARSHKLQIGHTGIVGYVAKTGKVRIALDTGADAIYFNNPDLPETRSEMALPLVQANGGIIGVLDIQSTEPNAFNQEDIEVLSTLADQVSVALANARLYEETQKALIEAEMVYRQDLRTGWEKFSRAQKLAGIRRRSMKSSFLAEPLELPGAKEVSQLGNIYQEKTENALSQLTMPVKLRGEVVGMLNLKADNNREWSADEMDIITAIIERAALAIENARLLDESRKVAEKERAIGEISAKIGQGIEIETILRTAVRELGAQISGAQVTVEIGGDNE